MADADSTQALEREVAALKARLEVRDGLLARAMLDKGEMLLRELEEARAREYESFELANLDGASRLIRHAAFRDRLVFEVERSRRTGDPLGLLVIDLDRFGEVNQRLGFAGADRVLLFLGQSLAGPWLAREAARPPVFAREGSDSFAVVLPAADRAEVIDRAEDVRSLVERLPFDPGSGQGMRLTASVGAVASSRGAVEADVLYAKARALADQARKAGGNRCAFEGAAEENAK